MKTPISLMWSVALFAVWNCGAAPEEEEAKPDSAMVEVTSVTMKPDGNHAIKKAMATRSEVKTWSKAREQHARDSAQGIQSQAMTFQETTSVVCNWDNWNALWLSDVEGVPLDAHRLCCINGSGSDWINNLCGSTWMTWSFWSGDLRGVIKRWQGDVQVCAQSFAANERQDLVSCTNANWVSLAW